jgi:hypothetical protein
MLLLDCCCAPAPLQRYAAIQRTTCTVVLPYPHLTCPILAFSQYSHTDHSTGITLEYTLYTSCSLTYPNLPNMPNLPNLPTLPTICPHPYATSHATFPMPHPIPHSHATSHATLLHVTYLLYSTLLYLIVPYSTATCTPTCPRSCSLLPVLSRIPACFPPTPLFIYPRPSR